MIEGLIFDPKEHRFSAPGGEPVLSLTQMLKAVGIIKPWKYKPGSNVRGSLVHLITQMHDEDTLVEDSIDPRLRGYYDAYLSYLAAEKPVYAGIEIIASNEIEWYACIIDRLMFYDGQMAVMDIKSGVTEDWHELQLIGQAECVGATRGYDLYLTPKGKYRLVRAQIKSVARRNEWRNVLAKYHQSGGRNGSSKIN